MRTDAIHSIGAGFVCLIASALIESALIATVSAFYASRQSILSYLKLLLKTFAQNFA
ncbi:MAG: hypothetical protein Fur0046_03590 [Cyanobacteria bacterium J069]